MEGFLQHYWPHILAVISFLFGATAAIHATMTKDEVRAAIGWVGVIMLSPILGALIYAVAGINRMRRASVRDRRTGLYDAVAREEKLHLVSREAIAEAFGPRMAALWNLGNSVAGTPATAGNTVRLLTTGDDAYAAMLEAIDRAEHSILMETYIFDADSIGRRFVDSLAAAVQRGVEVRILIDSIGARYSRPRITGLLRDKGVRVATFNGAVLLRMRLPYANLRTHRKIMVIDGDTAFAGGMNIREAFTGKDAAHDTHFELHGPAVADYLSVAATDWYFETGEALEGPAWQFDDKMASPDGVVARIVPSGPDRNLGNNNSMIIGALSVAEERVMIMSPYFLPDRDLVSALATASRRGVKVDIVVPGANNLALVDYAMTAQFAEIIRDGTRIWRDRGPFNHSKLMTIDGKWSYLGSSNMDARSLRLNFETDMEVFDADFANDLETRIGGALTNSERITLEALAARPFVWRLRDRILWLGLPYL
ncbi:phospholipase D-like domain-containing protein [Martelella endophytica]|uniref:Phospholipase D n=1 Tax=Martelella endophytica TaxID=1486262 RepID=A0A0D5LTS3_MAREN|nr:phospholipase D-like domain-containing protein [Martelella endophytica]AJY47167.1 cardiolipin synthetase [Martelella endophytica]